MQQIDQREFVHKGHRFEMRLNQTPQGFSVLTFLDGEPVSPNYNASYETHADWLFQTSGHIKEHLYAMAKSDIEQEMYIIIKDGEQQRGIEIRAPYRKR